MSPYKDQSPLLKTSTTSIKLTSSRFGITFIKVTIIVLKLQTLLASCNNVLIRNTYHRDNHTPSKLFQLRR
jgi:hypothetical protein